MRYLRASALSVVSARYRSYVPTPFICAYAPCVRVAFRTICSSPLHVLSSNNDNFANEFFVFPRDVRFVEKYRRTRRSVLFITSTIYAYVALWYFDMRSEITPHVTEVAVSIANTGNVVLNYECK